MAQTPPALQSPERISFDDWTRAVEKHSSRLNRWAEDRRKRSSLHIPHPVYDFLFNYYSFKPSQLLRWSPGIGVLLEGATRNSFPGAQDFSETSDGIILLPEQFPTHRIKYLKWASQYLIRVGEREPLRSCFGLHEWAMLYHTEAPRYADIQLRVSAKQIADCCETLGLRCTHYDAFRFFTPAATPLNARPLSREKTVNEDQPGCIHVVMDLYRFAYKIAPFSSSSLVADTFELAAAAREIDMRASPYDLRDYNMEPIKIEQTTGRAEYVELQTELFQRSIPLRQRVFDEYQALLGSLEAINTSNHTSPELNINVLSAVTGL